MKKIFVIILLILMSVTLSGCLKYGKGETTGYVFAVDDGIFWDKVWYKSDLQSSNQDCYLIRDDFVKEELRDLPAGTQVKLFYDRHFWTIAYCPEGTGTDDEIIRYEVISDE